MHYFRILWRALVANGPGPADQIGRLHQAAYKGRLHGKHADHMGGNYTPRRIKFVLLVLTFAIILLAVSTISTIHVYLTKSPRSFLPSVYRIT